MSNLLKCPFRTEIDTCSNCNSRGTIYNYDKTCPSSPEIEYEPVETYKPVIEGIPTATTQVGKDKIRAYNKKRSTDHFKREIYPTLSEYDKRPFAKKHNLKT